MSEKTKKVINRLRRMGYDVREGYIEGTITVQLDTNKHYHVRYTVGIEEIEQSKTDIVDHIVACINSEIIKSL